MMFTSPIFSGASFLPLVPALIVVTALAVAFGLAIVSVVLESTDRRVPALSRRRRGA